MKHLLLSLSIFFIIFNSCQSTNSEKENLSIKTSVKEIDPFKNKGIGPIKKLTIDEEIDDNMVKTGKAIFNTKCIICHKTESKYIGPSPKGILQRRTPEWIMNMMLNPQEMIKKDPIAQKLLKEYKAPMPSQDLSKKQARALLEYFRILK